MKIFFPDIVQNLHKKWKAANLPHVNKVELCIFRKQHSVHYESSYYRVKTSLDSLLIFISLSTFPLLSSTLKLENHPDGSPLAWKYSIPC